MIIPEIYRSKVNSRSMSRYYIGLIVRFLLNIKYAFFRWMARHNGATIGENTLITWKLARRVNKNLIIGEDCSIETANLDLRFGGGKIIIHDHVIINKEVQIIRVSHHIDDNAEFSTRYFPDLHIGSYSWIATGAKILPQVTNIEEGCVCGAFSVITKNCEQDGIYVGNPARMVRKHNTRFKDIVVCSLKGGDYNVYKDVKNVK